jgi:hypothetical protein
MGDADIGEPGWENPELKRDEFAQKLKQAANKLEKIAVKIDSDPLYTIKTAKEDLREIYDPLGNLI